MADRIGVINKGELILVEEKAELMRKLGKKQLTLYLQAPLDALPEALSPYDLELGRGRKCARLHLRHARRAHRHHPAAGGARRRRHPLQGSPDQRELARGHLRQPGERPQMNPQAVWAIYKRRDGADLPHHHAERRRAGAVDLALFHRLRRGDRLAHQPGRRHQLRRLHRARADHAVAAYAEHFERLDRHLLPEIHRHVLRDSLGADLLSGNRHQLCRRGGDEIGDARADHPGDLDAVRAAAHRASAGDAAVPAC